MIDVIFDSLSNVIDQVLDQVCKAQLSALVMLLTVGVITDGQAQSEPLYLGTFKNTAHRVAGDIFIIDQKTIYIQDFAHDGQAPDVFFWADGVIVPTSPEPTSTPRSASRDSSPARTLSCCCQRTNPQSSTSTDWRFGAGHLGCHLDILTWQTVLSNRKIPHKSQPSYPSLVTIIVIPAFHITLDFIYCRLSIDIIQFSK